MEIKCLVENHCINSNIEREHGLSLFIKTNDHNILFDLGQGDLFLKNAKLLNVDLKSVDILVISHGHYDHGGGLEYFLKENSKAKVYLSKHAFGDFYNGKEKYIGLNKLIDKSRLILTENMVKIDENVRIFSNSQIKKVYPFACPGLYEKKGEFLLDEFLHEQHLEIKEGGKSYVFCGCSHVGVMNVCEFFKPNYLIGGFHLKDIQVEENFEFFKNFALVLNNYPTNYITCHCTGIEQFNLLKEFLKNKLSYLYCGQTLKL